MNKIVIITDSTADLPSSIIQERNIKVLPLKVLFNGKEYEDTNNLDPHDMYKIIDETNSMPKTSGITAMIFEEEFEKILENDPETDIFFTGISQELSTTYQNAMIAKNSLDDKYIDKVHIIDSKNLSSGIALIVLKMCDLRDEGKNAKEIEDEINNIIPCVRAQFSVKELTYLHKGGRCSGTARFFGTMLRIHPILRVFQGKIILSEKIFGRYEKALDFQIEDIKNNLNNVDDEYLFITDSGDPEINDYIYNTIPETIKNKFKHIYRTVAGRVVSAHCGPSTIGILYIKKTPLLDDK